MEKIKPILKNKPAKRIRENNTETKIKNSLVSMSRLFLLIQIVTLSIKLYVLLSLIIKSELPDTLRILLTIFFCLSIIKIATALNMYNNPSPIHIEIIIDTLICNHLFH
jgi:hypothetical protein